MKRVQLFEFEDQPWFPNWMRIRLTRLIVVMHKILGTPPILTELIGRGLKASGEDRIIDLCSGSGGPLPEVLESLHGKTGFESVSLVLTDLYPNLERAEHFNREPKDRITYRVEPVDATHLPSELNGLRTMVGSFHHMDPDNARKILQAARKGNHPICILEISDNGFPIWANFVALPINFLMCLLITPLVRPMSWQQLLFTYLVPVLPLTFAWDGAVSNARTYTLDDLDELLGDQADEDYKWEKGVIKGRARMIYLLGLPAKA